MNDNHMPFTEDNIQLSLLTSAGRGEDYGSRVGLKPINTSMSIPDHRLHSIIQALFVDNHLLDAKSQAFYARTQCLCRFHHVAYVCLMNDSPSKRQVMREIFRSSSRKLPIFLLSHTRQYVEKYSCLHVL